MKNSELPQSGLRVGCVSGGDRRRQRRRRASCVGEGMRKSRSIHIPVRDRGGASSVGDEDVRRRLVDGKVGLGAFVRVEPTLDDKVRTVERPAVVHTVRDQLADVCASHGGTCQRRPPRSAAARAHISRSWAPRRHERRARSCPGRSQC
eukprot:4281088-Prymnesium_polylepis.1